MKRTIACLLALCLLIGLMPMRAQAAEVVDSGTCGENATWVLTDDRTLTISGEGPVDSAPWSSYRDSITSVIIEDGVTSFGAFQYYFALTSVEIGNDVTTIGQSAFANCTSLTNVMFGNSVTTICDWAFDGCSNLTSVTIPESVTSIGVAAFRGLDSATGIYVDKNNAYYSSDDRGVLFDKEKTQLIQAPGAISGDYAIPASVTRIGGCAFMYCSSLTGVTIPDGVTTIGGSAFEECIGLTSLVIPNSVTDIEKRAFRQCDSLSNVTIGNSVTSAGFMAFAYCGSLNEITFCGDAPSFGNDVFFGTTSTVYYPADNPTWTEEVMQQHGGTLTWVPYSNEEPTIPEIIASGWSGYTTWTLDDTGLLTISPSDQTLNGKCNMRNYWKEGGVLSLPWSNYTDQVTAVVIEEGVHAIGQMAFYDLPNLQRVVLPESLEEIRNYAFKLGTALNEINLENVDYIRGGAFYGCTSLAEVTLGEDTIVESWAFSRVPGYAG